MASVENCPGYCRTIAGVQKVGKSDLPWLLERIREAVMKYLLLIALIGVIWWRWKKNREEIAQEKPRGIPPPENMVVCAHCWVHLPESDALSDGARVYCCEAHRQAERAVDR